MQIWGRSSDIERRLCACSFLTVLPLLATCMRSPRPTYARAKACEAMLLDGELARFRAHAPSGVDIDAYVRRALAKHRFRLPHRDRFPFSESSVSTTAVEIGVREGHWSRMFLGRWRGRACHGVDPLLLSADLEAIGRSCPRSTRTALDDRALENDPRWHFHHGLDHKFVGAFSDGSLTSCISTRRLPRCHRYLRPMVAPGCGRGHHRGPRLLVGRSGEEKRGRRVAATGHRPGAAPPASRPATSTRMSTSLLPQGQKTPGPRKDWLQRGGPPPRGGR